MTDRLGLADFLADLRAELALAQERAEGEPLKLGVDRVEVSVDVSVTVERTVEGRAGARARFWVASAEADVAGTSGTERARTQHLTLTLTPRVEDGAAVASGAAQRHRGLDVGGEVGAGEESPGLPMAPSG